MTKSAKAPVRVLQVLLFRDGEISHELGLPLWAAFQEVEALFNHDRPRAEFQRFYLAHPDHIPHAVRSEMTLDWSAVAAAFADKEFWQQARGPFRNLYDQEELAQLARRLLRRPGKPEPMVLVTDLELTPPPEWRYILWDWCQDDTTAVVSLAPMDPLYWGERGRTWVATVKQRARSACCSAVGEHLSLDDCDNPWCYLRLPIESVLDLDEMHCIGPEHDLSDLTGLGFTPRVNDPGSVQLLARFEPPARGGA